MQETTKKFKVTVILPTYNGGDRIESAIRSVLRQDYENIELIVIDDGSTDDTKSIVDRLSIDDPRIIYLENNKNLGIQKSLNRGIREATGKYIARIDDDDEWITDNKISQQVYFLETNPDYELVGTGVVVVDEAGKELMRYLLPERDDTIRQSLLGKNMFVHSSVMFKKETVERIGFYSEDEAVKHVEDYDLWLRLGIEGKLANLPFFGVKFALRSENISSQNKIDQFRKNITLIRKYKKDYNRSARAFLRGYMRLLFYGVFNLIPIKALKNKILFFYKTQ